MMLFRIATLYMLRRRFIRFFDFQGDMGFMRAAFVSSAFRVPKTMRVS